MFVLHSALSLNMQAKTRFSLVTFRWIISFIINERHCPLDFIKITAAIPQLEVAFLFWNSPPLVIDLFILYSQL